MDATRIFISICLHSGNIFYKRVQCVYVLITKHRYTNNTMPKQIKKNAVGVSFPKKNLFLWCHLL